MHKIRAHDTDIQGLSWCPSPYNTFEGDNDRTEDDEGEEEDFLLAVAARDKTFTIWSFRTAMKVAALTPSRGGGRAGGKHNNQTTTTTQDKLVGHISIRVTNRKALKNLNFGIFPLSRGTRCCGTVPAAS